jgi:hypothetical protein
LIGPSDTSWTWISEKPIDSLRGEWRATGTGKLVIKELNLKDDKLDVKVTSRDASWSDQIHGPGDPRSPVHVWARVHIPSNPILARRKVQLELTLDVIVPEADEQQQRVVERHHEVPFTGELHLASYGAGFLYGFFWSIAAIGGGTMFLLAGCYHLLRDAALKRSGLPTRVTALSDEELEQRASGPENAADAPPGEPPGEPTVPHREQTEA